MGREKAEFLKEMHPKKLEGHVRYTCSFFSCSNEFDLRETSGILDRGLFGLS
jgi:hypothetical protein